MEQPVFNKFLNYLNHDQQKFVRFISPIIEEDKKLLRLYLNSLITKIKKDQQPNFEDSFEYIRLYFNSGRFEGFKFYNDKEEENKVMQGDIIYIPPNEKHGIDNLGKDNLVFICLVPYLKDKS